MQEQEPLAGVFGVRAIGEFPRQFSEIVIGLPSGRGIGFSAVTGYQPLDQGVACLLYTSLGMGGLASGSELIAMRAAGLSLMRLTGSALQAGLLLSLVVLAIGEFVAPPLEQAAREQRAVAKTENLAIRGGRGFWARDGDYFIHVRAVLPGVRLVDIHIFKINPGSAQLETLTAAQGARYVEGHWLLEEVNRSSLNGDEVQTEHLAQLSVVSAISPQILDVLAANPDELSIRDLRIYVTYLEGNGLDAQNYRLALWRKLLAPLAYMAMLVVAMPFVFGPSRSSGAGQRIVIGLLLGLLFFLFHYLLGNVVLLYGLPPLVGAGLPTLLFLGAGGYALRLLR